MSVTLFLFKTDIIVIPRRGTTRERFLGVHRTKHIRSSPVHRHLAPRTLRHLLPRCLHGSPHQPVQHVDGTVLQVRATSAPSSRASTRPKPPTTVGAACCGGSHV